MTRTFCIIDGAKVAMKVALAGGIGTHNGTPCQNSLSARYTTAPKKWTHPSEDQINQAHLVFLIWC